MNRKVLKMTNREKLLNTNIYDLLVSMNKPILMRTVILVYRYFSWNKDI